MKKIMKKITLSISVFLAVLFLLTGCTADGTASGTETSSTDVTEPVVSEPSELLLAENGQTEYRIIRAMRAGNTVIEAMQKLRAEVLEMYSTDIRPSEDFVKGYSAENPYESDAPEIIIGNTNRKESQDVLKTLNKGEWKVCVIENKLIMIGYNDLLTEMAVEAFIDDRVNNKSEKLAIPADLELFGKAKYDYTPVGDTDASLRIMTFNVLGDDTSVQRATLIAENVLNYDPDIVCLQECNSTQHKNALKKLKDAGYKIALEKHPGTSTYIYTPIFYRPDRIKLLDTGVEWNEKRWPFTNTKSIAWAVFRHTETDEIFGVVNIHGSLWTTTYDPAKIGENKTYEQMRSEAVLWRQDNVRQMAARMEEIKKEYGDVPVLWAGDFNFKETEPAYSDAVNKYGMAAAEKTATVSKMTGATAHSTPGQAPSAGGKSIDHIFGNSRVIFRIHHICKAKAEIDASDHCAVYADVKFAEP